MNGTLKNYYQIVRGLQPVYSKTQDNRDSNQKLFKEFAAKLKDIFKSMDIKFDTTVTKALIKRLQQDHRHFYYEENFQNTFKFVKRFNQVLKKEKFIGLRDYNFLTSQIKCYENDPCLTYFMNVCYLKKAESKQDFREDFLWKYMKISDQQIQEWTDTEFSQAYNQFWSKLFAIKPHKKLVIYLYSCFTKYENIQKMLKAEIRQRILQEVGQDIGSTEIQVELNKELKATAIQNFYQNSSQSKQRINKQAQMIEGLLHQFSATKKIKQELKLELRLAKFGSLVSGFGGTDSDLDITILTNCYVNQNNFLMYLLDFLKIQCAQLDKKTGRTTKVQKIDGATPLVEVQITQMRRQSAFKIDILVNNTLGVLNSKLLSVYAQVPWIKQLGILFKLWAKSKGLIGKQLLSSYAMILMMIYFLINQKYINVVYNAQARTGSTPSYIFKRIKNGQKEQFPVYFQFKKQVKDVTQLKNVSLSELFQQLLKFYSNNGDHFRKNQGKNIISIDNSYEKDFDQQYCFTIKDPFDKPHNPGRAKIALKDFYHSSFQTGYNTMVELRKKAKKEDRQRLIETLFEKSI